jgi:hypothetical protein
MWHTTRACVGGAAAGTPLVAKGRPTLGSVALLRGPGEVGTEKMDEEAQRKGLLPHRRPGTGEGGALGGERPNEVMLALDPLRTHRCRN